MAFGMEALASEPDLLVLGEMGIGNTTAAAAIYHALYGGQAEDWVGRGTGVDDEGLRRKADAVRAAVARHKPYLDDPLQILARLGGRETAAIAGAILRRAPRAERRCCSMASWCARRRLCCSPSTIPLSTIASPPTSPPSARIGMP